MEKEKRKEKDKLKCNKCLDGRSWKILIKNLVPADLLKKFSIMENQIVNI